MGTALDTAIGLTFIFLLFSTIVSAIQELISWVLEWRADTMRSKLAELLADPSVAQLVGEFLAHPQVQHHGGTTNKDHPAPAPSYLPTGTFGAVLVDMFTGSSARDALPAMRRAFNPPPPDTGALGTAFASVLRLEALGDEGKAAGAFVTALGNATASQTPAEDQRAATLRYLEGVPQSILKTLALAALEAAPSDATAKALTELTARRTLAIGRLARVIAGRSPALAFSQYLSEQKASPARDALLAVLDAVSEESRETAVATVSTMITNAGADLKTLDTIQSNLPDGVVKDALAKIVAEKDAAERAVKAIDLTRLLVRDPLGELRHIAALLGPESEIGRKLRIALDAGAKTHADIVARVEGLFDDAMAHGSAVFRRRVHRMVVFISLGVALGANVDAIVLVRGLSTSTAMREAAVASATRWIHDHPQENSTDSATREASEVTHAIVEADEELHIIALPIGWTGAALRHARSSWGDALLKVLGLLLSAFAMSLGAPFWFGLVNRLVNIRAVGKPSPPDAPATTSG